MSTTILGYRTSAPIIIAPTAMHKLANPRGEVLTAKAAAGNIIMLRRLLQVAMLFASFSCAVYKRRDISALMVKRAEKIGFEAILLTVDAPRLGRMEAEIKNKED